MEEVTGKWPRIEFKVADDGTVQGSSRGRVIAKTTIPELNYDFFERAIVDWICGSIEQLPQR